MGLLDSIGSAISGAVDAATDFVDDIGIADVTAGFGGIIGDTFEAVGVDLGPLSDLVDGAMDVLSSGSFGAMIDNALDKLGMPDWIGDIGGGVLDFCTGNFAGAAARGLDALEDVAKACGGDELAGFLKAGSQITGMFSGAGSTGFAQIDEMIGSAGQSLAAVDQVLGGTAVELAGLDLDEDLVGQLATMADRDPDALGLVQGLLSQTAMSSDFLDTLTRHSASIRV